MKRHFGLTDADREDPAAQEALAAQQEVERIEELLRLAYVARDAAVTRAVESGSRGFIQRLADQWGVTRSGIDDMRRRARERAKSGNEEGHTESDGPAITAAA